MKGNQSEPNPQLHVHSSSHFVFPSDAASACRTRRETADMQCIRAECDVMKRVERPEIEAEPSDRELGNMHVTLTRTLVELPGSEIR
ncbi:hypothetical protein Q8A73_020904 [Channa argus]|nr:hypothetical protein Q8A73_020904 [Channa argus]